MTNCKCGGSYDEHDLCFECDKPKISADELQSRIDFSIQLIDRNCPGLVTLALNGADRDEILTGLGMTSEQFDNYWGDK